MQAANALKQKRLRDQQKKVPFTVPDLSKVGKVTSYLGYSTIPSTVVGRIMIIMKCNAHNIKLFMHGEFRESLKSNTLGFWIPLCQKISQNLGSGRMGLMGVTFFSFSESVFILKSFRGFQARTFCFRLLLKIIIKSF